MKKLARLGMIALMGGSLALGSVAFLQQPAYARPEPDCGPTFEWSCALPGCPDCYEILFEGTVCEKNAFEKKTGRVCTRG